MRLHQSLSPRRLRHPLLLAGAALLISLTSACDEKGPFRQLFSRDETVSEWARDSVVLASNPELLFRVVPDAGGALVVPIASIGPQGIRALTFSNRGWRRVDADYMHAGRTLVPYHNGKAEPSVRMFRGMWQPGAPPLDSLNCAVVIPLARAFSTGTSSDRELPAFATNGKRPPIKFPSLLSESEANEALRNIGTLVAPSAGVAPGQLSRYQRRVHQVPTGINGSATIVVEYNDDTPLPDTLQPFGERPRQLILTLDKGSYGYRPTYSFSTVGARGAQPKLQFLDYLDVDDDGVPELMLGLRDVNLAPYFVIVLRYENDAWREKYRFLGNRCTF